MAELLIDGDELVVKMDVLEKAESIHGDVRVPASAMREITVMDNVLDAIKGWRAGTGIPDVTEVGRFQDGDQITFAVVHHGVHEGVVVTLVGAEFSHIVVGCHNPNDVARRLQDGKDALAN
jgi:hypothetical protein